MFRGCGKIRSERSCEVLKELICLRCRKTGGIARWVTVVAAKPDGLGGIPRKGKLTQKRFPELYASTVAQACTHRQIKEKQLNIF